MKTGNIERLLKDSPPPFLGTVWDAMEVVKMPTQGRARNLSRLYMAEIRQKYPNRTIKEEAEDERTGE